ncbi:MAG TPA: hypothetical protein VFX40_05090, partial [Gemmatimonadaceae bacterium]|nr:hypothetical protein [Gemmatimonadaceae bacterium]
NLADWSRRSPRDGWITAQRIRYLLEIRDDSTAVKVASECRATAWWCDALRGLTLHEAGVGAAADSAFDRALSAMPEKERCRWTDMSVLLSPAQKRRYGKVGCGKNDAVASTLWWLADPFHSVPGNDRRAEHFARHTMAKIQEPTRIAYDIVWANDLREMMVRFGWARFWTQGQASMSDPYSGPISGHEATPNYAFLPVSLPVDSLHEVQFDLDADASAERYSPVLAKRLGEITPQTALFRRGDSALVAVAYDLSRRKPFDSASVRSALVLAPDETSARMVEGRRPKGTLTAMMSDRPHVLSLEVLSLEKGHAAWHRTGVWLPATSPGEVSVSDVLMFEAGPLEVRQLEEALSSALPGNEVKRGRTGFYWEIYGLSAADSALPVSLSLTPVGRGTIRRIGESIGLARRASPLNIVWRDTPGLGSISARSIVLDLSLVPRGRYELSVGVQPKGKPPATSRRTILVQ